MENTLTLEHVSAYLPYKLKAYQTVFTQVKGGKDKATKEIRIVNSTTIYNFFQLGKYKAHEHVKPILRPLSDLTKEIEHNGVKFVTKDFIHYTYPSEMIGLNPATWSYRVLIKLFELHFDVFNLIPQNLAIDINTI